MSLFDFQRGQSPTEMQCFDGNSVWCVMWKPRLHIYATLKAAVKSNLIANQAPTSPPRGKFQNIYNSSNLSMKLSALRTASKVGQPYKKVIVHWRSLIHFPLCSSLMQEIHKITQKAYELLTWVPISIDHHEIWLLLE